MLSKEDIVRVLHDTNFWGSEQKTGSARNSYLDRMLGMKNAKEAFAIVGVRRAGKSTLAKQFLNRLILDGLKKEQTLYVSFEEPVFSPYLNLELIDTIYDAYRENVNPDGFAFVVLDEVQNIPAWEKWVRVRQENEKIKVLVTGSSSKLLSSEFSTVLSGRSISLTVFPLSFREFVQFKGGIKKVGDVFMEKRKINSLLKEYLEFGGFPRVALEEKQNKMALLKEYFTGIIFRDVAARYDVKETEVLEALAVILLANIATPVSIGKLAGILQESFKQKTSLETVSRFLHYFESAFLVSFVPIFSYRIKEQMQYPRKVYSIDTGLRNMASFRFSEDIGRLYENAVFLELERAGKKAYYWKNKQGKEVDFIVKEGLKVTEAIQVCFDSRSNKTKKREVSALIECLDEFSLKKGLILTESREEEEKTEGKTIKYMPLWKWLLENKI